MNRARMIVLIIAIAAGGMAVKLISMMDNTPAPPPPPSAQIDANDVLVASTNIDLGQELSSQNIAWQAWPATTAGAFITKGDHEDAIQHFTGMRARIAFAAGEPIQEAKLVKGGSGYLAAILPKDMRAIAVEITPENGAGGFILPRDHVDVILTQTPVGRAAENSSSDTILWNVPVLAIDQNVDNKGGQSAVPGKIATLELTSRQAETLALARKLGTLSLALRSVTDTEETPGDDEVALNKRDSVNIVRYGIGTMIFR